MTTEETGATQEQEAPAELEAELPAGFWVRAGAAFIDGLVVMAVVAVLTLAIAGVVSDQEQAAKLLQLATVLVGATYYTALTGFAGQTIGKMAAGARVIRTDGVKVSYLRALGRWAAYSLSSLPVGLGFVGAAFNRRRRALHDVVSGTRVVYVPGVTAGRKAVMACLGVLFTAALAALVALSAAPPENAGDAARIEGAAAGNIRALRAMVGIYRAEQGRNPAQLEDLSKLSDFTGLPELRLAEHGPQGEAVTYPGAAPQGRPDPAKLKDTGRWGYDPESGAVFIDCTHLDSEATAWYEF